MNHRTFGFIVLLDVTATIIWLVCIIGLGLTTGMPETFEQAMAFATARHPIFYTLNYANAVLLTLLTASVYAGLYALLKDRLPVWAEIGFVFVPVYAIIALFSYLSQLVIIPSLMNALAEPETQSTASVILRNLIQIWPESTLQQFDQFSYFLLSIPGIIYGIGLYRYGRPFRATGVFFILSSLLCLPIGFGVLMGRLELVGIPSMIGGVLSIFAFTLLGVNLLRSSKTGAQLKTIPAPL